MRKTVDRSANRVKYAFNKIRRAAQVVASAFIFTAGIRRLGMLVAAMEKAADQVALMEARFQQFARIGDSLTRVYKISKTLGVSMQETAQGMTKLLVATKSIGTAQPVLEEVYKNVVLLGRAGGTSAEEMTGGMRQLFQGLASNRLQGEELRSVLENLPLVAMEIADEMEISIGQIRQAAAEGKITGEIVIAALEKIGIKMEDLPQTWAMQTENLRTEWSLFLAELGNEVESAGLLRALTEAVKWVRINMMGSMIGISVEELRQQQIEASRQVLELESKLATASQKNMPSGGGRAGIEAMAAYGDGGDEMRLVRAHATLRTINDELARRAQLEQLAEKNAAAREAANTREYIEAIGYLKTISAIDPYDAVNDAWERINKKVESYNVEQNIANALLREFTIRDPYDETEKAWDRINKKVKESTEEMSEFAKQAARNMQDAFADFFYNIGTGFDNMVEDFLNSLRKMFANQLAIQFMEGVGQPLLNALGFRASGGPVTAGQPYIVGEKGPEMWVPQQSGMILPNHALAGAGGPVIHYNIDARGADEATVVARMIPLLERTVQITKGEIRQDMNEGRF
jgi:tape measure domain-containing protein